MDRLSNDRFDGRFSLLMAGDEERAQIYRMRHAVYARELHQHSENERGELTDALDAKNVYVVAKWRGRVLGFVSVTLPPGPYSLDKYLPREDWPAPAGERTYEVRLLTVTAEARGTPMAAALMYAAMRYVQWNGGQHVVGIGRDAVMGMYERAGMKPSGRVVSSGNVKYHVMAAKVNELEAVASANEAFIARMLRRLDWELAFPARQKARAACFHGGASIGETGTRLERIEEARGIVNADVLDAWFEPSPRVIEALREHLPWLARTSPPADCGPLLGAIGDVRGVPRESVAPGAGSSDLIFRCLRAWLICESKVLLLKPTYGEYAHILENVIGCRVERFRLDRQAHYAMHLGLLRERLRDKYDLVILVNPNSPTGTFVRGQELARVVVEAARHGSRVWVDETYVDYVGAEESLERLAASTRGLFVCKSMSKVYALSGMRLAYLCGHPEEIAAMRAITPPWVVGMAAQVAGVRALWDPEYYAGRYAETRANRAELTRELRELGLDVLEGPANFVLVEGAREAAELVRQCVSSGVYLRDAGSMGVREGRTVRIAVKSRQENARIVEAIGAVMANDPAGNQGCGPHRAGAERGGATGQLKASTSLIST